MASIIFTNAKLLILGGDLRLKQDHIKAMLVLSSYAPKASDVHVSDTGGNEPTVTGYQNGFNGSGRKDISSISVIVTGTQAEFHIASLTWPTLAQGANIQGLILYQSVSSDGNSPLIAYFDMGTAVPTDGQDFMVTFGTNGALILS